MMTWSQIKSLLGHHLLMIDLGSNMLDYYVVYLAEFQLKMDQNGLEWTKDLSAFFYSNSIPIFRGRQNLCQS